VGAVSAKTLQHRATMPDGAVVPSCGQLLG
jgi:hypothetical protein